MRHATRLSVECPECKGDMVVRSERHAQLCGAFVDDEENARFHSANCLKDERTCPVCNGSGFVSSLQNAIYMARGGAAPVRLRGHA